jgi:hypothetical protein
MVLSDSNYSLSVSSSQQRCFSTLCNGTRRIIFPTVYAKLQHISGNSEIKYYDKSGSNVSPLPPLLSGKKINGLASTSSIESEMPSLMSASTMSDFTTGAPSISRSANSNDLNATSRGKFVRFNPRIWVHEYERSGSDTQALWFTAQDLIAFKTRALQCIMAYNSNVQKNNMATSRSSVKSKKDQFLSRTGSVLFSHPALLVDSIYDNENPASNMDSTTSPLATTVKVTQFRDVVAENEIRNILVVDSEERFLKLYTKGLKQMMPHASIVTARCIENALSQVQKVYSNKETGCYFDVIINDVPTKGNEKSLLFSDISRITNKFGISTKAINISVCANHNIDASMLYKCGTDLIWTKPPPIMNTQLRDTMLKTLLIKRGRKCIAKKLF